MSLNADAPPVSPITDRPHDCDPEQVSSLNVARDALAWTLVEMAANPSMAYADADEASKIVGSIENLIRAIVRDEATRSSGRTTTTVHLTIYFGCNIPLKRDALRRVFDAFPPTSYLTLPLLGSAKEEHLTSTFNPSTGACARYYSTRCPNSTMREQVLAALIAEGWQHD